jgi:hypothetical protein
MRRGSTVRRTEDNCAGVDKPPHHPSTESDILKSHNPWEVCPIPPGTASRTAACGGLAWGSRGQVSVTPTYGSPVTTVTTRRVTDTA